MANEFVAKNGLISQNDTTVTGSITTTGNATIVNAFIGTITAFGSNYMAFSHISRATTSDYSLLSDNAGITYLNAKSGQGLKFRINNIDKMVMDSSGQIGIGTTTPSTALEVVGTVTATTFSGTVNGYVPNTATSSFVTSGQTGSMLLPYVLTSSTSSMLQPYVLTSATSSMTVLTAQTASYVLASNVVGTVTSASYALSASYAPGGGVTQIIAGTGVTVSPAGGTGNVTVNSSTVIPTGKLVAIATGYSNIF